MDSGYIEEEMDFFISNVQKLAQGELERYFNSVKLVRDYYQAIQKYQLALKYSDVKSHPKIYNDMGYILQVQGEYEEALVNFKAAIDSFGV
ncbi:MAG: hypothetical protein EOO92_09525 [Pedobacter sp.]|nr:MAG: hypothetical protein EOO92_09525 [Pedobacter sp.]